MFLIGFFCGAFAFPLANSSEDGGAATTFGNAARAAEPALNTSRSLTKKKYNVKHPSCKPLAAGNPNLAASMRDSETGLVIWSSPKAGATLTERIVLARGNLTNEAMEYARYPLGYSHNVFSKERGRRPENFNPAEGKCAAKKWSCFAIVRNPLDRAISSYMHVLKYFHRMGRSFKELGRRPNASFAEFVVALDSRALTGSRSRADDHFMPQWEVAPGGMDTMDHGRDSGNPPGIEENSTPRVT